MFVHFLWQVRDIEIGVAIVLKLLELRVEGFLGSLVTEKIKDHEMMRTLAKLVS